MPNPRRHRMTIRLDAVVKQRLVAQARRRGRNFSEHVRSKLEDGEELDHRLDRLERRTLFTVLAFQELFEGLGRRDVMDELIERLDRSPDPLTEGETDDLTESV